MLGLVTKYLLQYKRVSIPHIGSFELVQHAPQLDIADKIFRPPFFITRFKADDRVPEHQFRYLTASDGWLREELERELSRFGQKLKSKIRQSPFQWRGLGTLRFHENSIVFEADQINLPYLALIPAEKVIRENAQHQVLVGDQQMTSRQVTDVLNQPEEKRPLTLVVGWVIVILLLLAILVYLYMNRFQPAASGLRLKNGVGL